MFKLKNIRFMIMVLVTVMLVGCSTKVENSEKVENTENSDNVKNTENDSMITIELFEHSTDESVITSKMDSIFEFLGESYEYSYSGETITVTLPQSKADMYKSAIKEDVEKNLKQTISDGYINDVKINDDFTEIEFDITSETTPELADTMAWYFINMAITYQGFNGVLKDDVNVNFKSYINGEFNTETNITSDL